MHTWKNTRRKRCFSFFFFFSPGKLTVCTCVSILCSKRAATIEGFREFPSPPNSNRFLLTSASLLSLRVQSQPRKTSNAPASFVIPSHGLDCSLAARHCWGGKKGCHAPAATTTHSGSLSRPSKKKKEKKKKEAVSSKSLCFIQRNQSFQRACFLDSVFDLRLGVVVNTSLE